MPPPVRIVPMLASTRSVVGNAEAFFSGMVSPLFSSCCDGSGGGSSCTCCEPSSDVCPIFAKVFVGSFRFGWTSSVSVATQFFSSIARTLPTNTSATRTRLLTLSANVSGIWT